MFLSNTNAYPVNGAIPVSFFIFQTSKLFQSPDLEYQVGKSRRQAIGSRVISATVEGAEVTALPNGQEINTTFYELNVRMGFQIIYNFHCRPIKMYCEAMNNF